VCRLHERDAKLKIKQFPRTPQLKRGIDFRVLLEVFIERKSPEIAFRASAEIILKCKSHGMEERHRAIIISLVCCLSCSGSSIIYFVVLRLLPL
jgi:hypothetical protein